MILRSYNEQGFSSSRFAHVYLKWTSEINDIVKVVW